MADITTGPLSSSALLSVLGSFWTNTFGGREQIRDLVTGMAVLTSQQERMLQELVDTLSRLTVPVHHVETWFPIRIQASSRNDASATLTKFDGSTQFDGSQKYGAPKSGYPYHAFDIRDDLVGVDLIADTINAPTVTLHGGFDFNLKDGVIVFIDNPFEDARWPKENDADIDGEIIDQSITLWLYNAKFDRELIYRQYGYVIGMYAKSSEAYRDLVNAVWDTITIGPARQRLDQAISAITGVPRARQDGEIVERTVVDARGQLVITDKHAYRVSGEAVVIVAPGDVLSLGDPLCDTVQVHEFTRGLVPADLDTISLDKEFISACYYGSLVFRNEDLPLQVTEAAAHPSGHTFVKWELGGHPLDVSTFFEELHTRGVAATTLPATVCDDSTVRVPGDCETTDTYIPRATLAQLLDIRTNPVGEPTAASLPATINPMEFLIQNILRNNIALIRVKIAGLLPNHLGLQHLRILTKIVPAHTALLVVLETPPLVATLDPAQVQGSLLETLDATEPIAGSIRPNARLVTMRQVQGSCR